jgi:hypothetical protein
MTEVTNIVTDTGGLNVDVSVHNNQPIVTQRLQLARSFWASLSYDAHKDRLANLGAPEPASFLPIPKPAAPTEQEIQDILPAIEALFEVSPPTEDTTVRQYVEHLYTDAGYNPTKRLDVNSLALTFSRHLIIDAREYGAGSHIPTGESFTPRDYQLRETAVHEARFEAA